MTTAHATPAAKPTCLIDEHRRLGAMLAPFAGFLMPIRYGSIMAEHAAVRQRVGLFDLSHMCQIELMQPDAAAILERLTTNRVVGLRVGKARYSIITREDGGAVDDIIIYQLADRILIVANAANTVPVLEFLGKELDVTPRTDRALIALQGPQSAAVLRPLVNIDIDRLANYAIEPAGLFGHDVLVARTGYTGEDGFEIFALQNAAPQIFTALLEHGASHGIVPAGLAARDMLRLEAGMPLYGNELSSTITPLQAGLSWAVNFEKGPFSGRAALEAQRDTPYARVCGVRLRQAIPARTGYEVQAAGTRVGQICSATISPTLGGASIATALLDESVAEIGHTLEVVIRGTLYPAEVVALPFYRRARS